MLDLIHAATDMDSFLDRGLALKKETSINCIPIEEVRNNFQNKVEELKKEEEDTVLWMKEMGTESDSEESEFTSESSKEEERKREGKMPPEEPVISGRGTEALTRSEGSAKAINAELEIWNRTLELTLKRVEVPELKEKIIQRWFLPDSSSSLAILCPNITFILTILVSTSHTPVSFSR